MMILLSYMLLSAAVALYIGFGFNFLRKGYKLKKTDEIKGQIAYYKGMGLFILAVATSQILTIMDFISMDVYNIQFWKTTEKYDPAFPSLIGGDDYVVGFSMVLFSLIFLVYPLQKFLLAEKTVLSIVLVCTCPLPVLLRILEINSHKIGIDLVGSSVQRQIFTLLWIIVIIILVISVFYVLKLYLDLGRKSPRGSKLRKRCRFVIFGLIIWISTIFLTSEILGEINDVLSEFSPLYTGEKGTLVRIVHDLNLYQIFPFIVPSLLIIALILLISGFNREF